MWGNSGIPKSPNYFHTSQFPDFMWGKSGEGKKDLWSAHTPEIPSSRPDAPSTSSWCSPVRSRRTVRRGGEDRSWFGRPQAIKKAAGNAATKGTYASKVLSFQRHHPLQAVSDVVGAVYELPKKRRVPNPSAYDASSPHRREQIHNDGISTYESSPSRQNVAGVRQSRKRRVP